MKTQIPDKGSPCICRLGPRWGTACITRTRSTRVAAQALQSNSTWTICPGLKPEGAKLLVSVQISYTTYRPQLHNIQTLGGATCYSHCMVWKHVTPPWKITETSKCNYKKQHLLNLDIGNNYPIWIIYSSQAMKANSTLLRGKANFWPLWKAQELQFPCKAGEILLSKYFGSWIWSSSKFSMERLVFGFRH